MFFYTFCVVAKWLRLAYRTAKIFYANIIAHVNLTGIFVKGEWTIKL